MTRLVTALAGVGPHLRAGQLFLSSTARLLTELLFSRFRSPGFCFAVRRQSLSDNTFANVWVSPGQRADT